MEKVLAKVNEKLTKLKQEVKLRDVKLVLNDPYVKTSGTPTSLIC